MIAPLQLNKARVSNIEKSSSKFEIEIFAVTNNNVPLSYVAKSVRIYIYI